MACARRTNFQKSYPPSPVENGSFVYANIYANKMYTSSSSELTKGAVTECLPPTRLHTFGWDGTHHTADQPPLLNCLIHSGAHGVYIRLTRLALFQYSVKSS
jgi:hypothetical protein